MSDVSDTPDEGTGDDDALMKLAAKLDAQESGQGEDPPAQAEAQAPPEEDEDRAEPQQPEEQPKEAQPQSALYTVKIDGKETQVTLEELQNGYSRQADYTRKTQELSNTAKAKAEELVATETKALREERAKLADYVGRLAAKLETQIVPFPPKSMREPGSQDYNPDAYNAQLADAIESRENLRAVKDQQAALDAQKNQEREAQIREILKTANEKLASEVPEWADEKVRKEGQAAVAAFVNKAYGVPESDLKDLYLDPRLMLLSRDAMLYRELKDKKTIADTKVKDAPPVTKPGTAKGNGKDEQVSASRSALRKSGRTEDFAAVLQRMGF